MTLLSHLIEDLFRNLSGPIGNRFRRFYYKRKLKFLGKGVTIDTGVFLINPGFISIDDGVWIDKNCVLIAGIPDDLAENKDKNKSSDGIGELVIGSNSHIGIGTIIQAHGSVKIGKYFTCSANCRIYSYSNDYRNSLKGTMAIPSENYKPAYIAKPVIVGENVWLGLNVSVISASIDEDVFVMPHSVVYKSLEKNTVASGNPATVSKKRFDR
jgi:acetyltransferase-like isoleucine patch superfamily enzyme